MLQSLGVSQIPIFGVSFHAIPHLGGQFFSSLIHFPYLQASTLNSTTMSFPWASSLTPQHILFLTLMCSVLHFLCYKSLSTSQFLSPYLHNKCPHFSLVYILLHFPPSQKSTGITGYTK